jgi:hypothetical protein
MYSSLIIKMIAVWSRNMGKYRESGQRTASSGDEVPDSNSGKNQNG